MGMALKIDHIPLLALCMACATVIGAVWFSRRKQRQQPPSKWRHVGKLTAINLYPLKSGHVISLQEAECTKTGLVELKPARDGVLRLRDRCMIVYDAVTGDFVTARKLPRLLLIKVKADGLNSVVFSAPDGDTLKVILPQKKDNLAQVTMWFGEVVWTADCGDEAAAWLSKHVAQKPSNIRLGYDLATQIVNRTVDSGPWEKYKKVFTNLTSSDMGMYADLTSYMLMTESSVEDARTKMPEDIAPYLTIQIFRPSFVVGGSAPYEEDTWKWVRIGENVILRDVKPCTRCSLTTINPITTERFRDMEPLRTLKKYRKLTKKGEVALEGDAPVLGRYMGLYQSGIVNLGDDIFVSA